MKSPMIGTIWPNYRCTPDLTTGANADPEKLCSILEYRTTEKVERGTNVTSFRRKRRHFLESFWTATVLPPYVAQWMKTWHVSSAGQTTNIPVDQFGIFLRKVSTPLTQCVVKVMFRTTETWGSDFYSGRIHNRCLSLCAPWLQLEFYMLRFIIHKLISSA